MNDTFFFIITYGREKRKGLLLNATALQTVKKGTDRRKIGKT